MQTYTRADVVFIAAFLADMASDTAALTLAQEQEDIESGDATAAEFAEEGNMRYGDAAACATHGAALMSALGNGEQVTDEQVTDALHGYDTEWRETLCEMFVFYAVERKNTALVKRLDLFGNAEIENELLANAEEFVLAKH